MSEAEQTARDLARAEAVAWLTTLQGERTAATERAFRSWLAADPANGRAFAAATDVWEMLPGAIGGIEMQIAPLPPRRRPLRSMALAACVALLMIVGGMTAYLNRDPVYETMAGQQQTLTLEDGTEVALNTDSRLSVDYAPDERVVRLERGEVLFNVAANPKRPFIVDAGKERIRAVGTSFVVRREGDRVAVTLLEGKVIVSRSGGTLSSSDRRTLALAPGERLTLANRSGGADLTAKPEVDRPRLEAVTAWRQGELMLDDQPLAEAAREINRYGGTPVVLGDPQLARLRISGVFATRNPDQFAQLIAQTHGLRVERSTDAIALYPR